MESQKYCVYNQTRESFLSLEVTMADARAGELRDLIERLTVKPDSGLWMMPYRGIPSARGLSPIDLVYLDSDYCVIQEVESFPTSTVEPLKEEAASALVLPAHTIYSSQTQPGDQLVICVAGEMERRLERLSSSFVSTPNASGNVLPPCEKAARQRLFTSIPLRQPVPRIYNPFFRESDEMNNCRAEDRQAEFTEDLAPELAVIGSSASAPAPAAGSGCLLLDWKRSKGLPDRRCQFERILRPDRGALVSGHNGIDDTAKNRRRREKS